MSFELEIWFIQLTKIFDMSLQAGKVQGFYLWKLYIDQDSSKWNNIWCSGKEDY